MCAIIVSVWVVCGYMRGMYSGCVCEYMRGVCSGWSVWGERVVGPWGDSACTLGSVRLSWWAVYGEDVGTCVHVLGEGLGPGS